MDHTGTLARHSRAFVRRKDQVGAARRFTREILGDHPRCDDLVLIVDELAANAVLHAAGETFEVTILTGTDQVCVYVGDGGAETSPHIPAPRQSATDGRGLAIVDALADAWGYHGTGGHGVTWCVLGDPSAASGLPQLAAAPASRIC